MFNTNTPDVSYNLSLNSTDDSIDNKRDLSDKINITYPNENVDFMLNTFI